MKVFAQLLRAYFGDAAEARGEQTRCFRIAGRTVAMVFAGERRVAEFSKALSHLRAPISPADLTLYVWDGESAARNHLLRAYLFTLTNWWFDFTGPRGQLLDIHGGDVTAFYDPLSGLLSVLDYSRGSGFLWKRDVSEMPYFEACAPARVLLHAWLKRQGLQMVHGAAVGTEDGGVLLVGPGGSGKSTSALACLDSELQYLSDDYCIVQRDGTGFRLHGLYGTTKLADENNFRRFPRLSGGVWNRDRAPEEKAALFINERWPDKLIHDFPLAAIVAPIVSGTRETAMEPCSRAQALKALAPSTMAQMPSSGPEDLAFMSNMVRSLACYRLRAGTELGEIPRAIGELLAPAPACVRA